MKTLVASTLTALVMAGCTLNLGGETTSTGTTSDTSAASSGATTGSTSGPTGSTSGATGSTSGTIGSTSGTAGSTSGATGGTAGTTGGTIACTQAGGECVGLTPENCVGGTVLNAEQYSCGSGAGAECCVPAGQCQTEWVPEPCQYVAQCDCADGTPEDFGCVGPPTCAAACCAHGGIGDGGQPDSGCVSLGATCETGSGTCCDGATCLPSVAVGFGTCGFADAGSCTPAGSSCTAAETCCSGAYCLSDMTPVTDGGGICGFFTGGCVSEGESCSPGLACCTGLACGADGTCVSGDGG